MDLSIKSTVDDQGRIEFDIPDNFGAVSGNAMLSNRFAITLLTNTDESMLSYGYGGNLVSALRRPEVGASPSAIAASAKSACDAAVAAMVLDQGQLPTTEQISSAAIESVEKVRDRVYISIRITPIQLDAGAVSGPLVTLPL